MTFSKTIKKSAGSFPIRLQNPGIFRNFVTTKWIQGKTAKIGCGLFGVSKNFYNLNTLTYWLLRYRFSYRILHSNARNMLIINRLRAFSKKQTEQKRDSLFSPAPRLCGLKINISTFLSGFRARRRALSGWDHKSAYRGLRVSSRDRPAVVTQHDSDESGHIRWGRWQEPRPPGWGSYLPSELMFQSKRCQR